MLLLDKDGDEGLFGIAKDDAEDANVRGVVLEGSIGDVLLGPPLARWPCCSVQ